MDPELLKTFVAITETGNFTSAADRVNRSQGAVSQMVKRLEDRLGHKLFLRSAAGVSLTDQGRLLLPHARTILAAQAEALAAFDRSELDGFVGLGMPEIYAENLIPRILPRFQAQYPKVKIRLELRDTGELMRLLADGSLDLTFATDGEVDNMTGPVVHESPVCWIAPIGSALEDRDPLPVVMWKRGSNYERVVLAALREAGRDATVVINTQTIGGLYTSVRANLGVAATTMDTYPHKVRVLRDTIGLPAIAPRKLRLERAYSERNRAVDHFHEHILNVLAP